jgi:hypothetical protein
MWQEIERILECKDQKFPKLKNITVTYGEPISGQYADGGEVARIARAATWTVEGENLKEACWSKGIELLVGSQIG